MSLRTLSQNKHTLKRFNTTNTKYAQYWATNFTNTGGLNNGFGAYGIKNAKKLAIDSTGAIYHTISTTLGAGNNDHLLVKFDKSGNVLWQKALGASSSNDGPVAVFVDSSDNVYIIGGGGSSVSNGLIVAKYNSSGTLVWAINKNSTLSSSSYRIYGGSLTNNGSTILVTGDFAGTTYYGIICSIDAATGNFNYFYRIGGGTSSTYSTVYDANSDGTTLIAFSTYYNNGFVVNKTDLATFGTPYGFLSNRYSGAGGGPNNGGCVFVDSSGYFYIVMDGNAGVLKMDSNYNVIWTRYFNSTYLNGVHIDSSGTIFIGMRPQGTGGTTFYIVKMNSSGTVLWSNAMTAPDTNVNMTGICADPTGASIAISFTPPYTTTSTTSPYATIFNLPADGSLNGGQVSFNGYSYTSASISATIATTTLLGSSVVGRNSISPVNSTYTLVDQTVTHTFAKSAFSY